MLKLLLDRADAVFAVAPLDGRSTVPNRSEQTPGAGTGARLGTRLRGALANAYQARGAGQSNLTFAYSAKADMDVVLRSTLEFGHFLLCEGCSEITSVVYNGGLQPGIVDGRVVMTEFDAVVTMSSGMVEYREVKSSDELADPESGRTDLQLAAQAAIAVYEGGRHVVMTEREIFANEMLIRNWNRVLPWLAQVRDIPLDEHLNAVRRLVESAGAICLADVVNLGEADESAVFGAAALKGVQTGLFLSDLGVRPFGEGTLIASRSTRS
jgi:hypothetical protein